MADDIREEIARAAAEAWFRRPVSEKYMATPCTGSARFFEIADAVLAIIHRWEAKEPDPQRESR